MSRFVTKPHITFVGIKHRHIEHIAILASMHFIILHTKQQTHEIIREYGVSKFT